LNKCTKEILQVIIFAAIGIVLFWYAIRGENIAQIIKILKGANYWWVLLSLVFALLSNISRAVRWNMLIKPLGYTPRLRNTFAAVCVAYFANLALPRLGEVSRCAILGKYEKAPVAKIFGTVIIERLIDVFTLFIILLITVVLQFKVLDEFTHTYVIDPLKGKLDMLAHSGTTFYCIVAGSIVVLILIIYFGIKMLSKMHFYERLKHMIKGFIEGIRTIENIEHKGWFLFHSIFIWLMYYLMAYICFFCFGVTTHLGVLAGLSVLVFGSIGFAAPVQGGFGAYHAMVTQTLLLYGINRTDGMAYAILTHTSQTLGMIIFGLASLVALPLMNSNYKKKEVVIKSNAPL
jgi:glycosyltransferase 2 family protein